MDNTELRLIDFNCGVLQYFASSDGTIYRKMKGSKPRTDREHKRGFKQIEINGQWYRPLAPAYKAGTRENRPTGYARVELNNRQVMVHRLIAQTFIPNPLNKPQVNHKNGNIVDNSVSNLEWVTASENMLHAYETGLNKPSYGNLNRKRPKRCPLIENYQQILLLLTTTLLTNSEIASQCNSTYNRVKKVKSICKAQRPANYDFRKQRFLGVENSVLETEGSV